MIDAAVVGEVWEAGTVTSFDKGSSQGFLNVQGRSGAVHFFKRPAKDAGFSCEDLVRGASFEVMIKGREDGGFKAWKFKPKGTS